MVPHLSLFLAIGQKLICKRSTENDDQFRSLLFRRCILEYRYIDGEGEVRVWHDVHPLVRGLDGFKRALDRYEHGGVSRSE